LSPERFQSQPSNAPVGPNIRFAVWLAAFGFGAKNRSAADYGPRAFHAGNTDLLADRMAAATGYASEALTNSNNNTQVKPPPIVTPACGLILRPTVF